MHIAITISLVFLGSFLHAEALSACSIAERFLEIRDAIPEQVGECRGPAQTDVESGELVQPTSGGWLVFREFDSSITFTNGLQTWQQKVDGVYIINDLSVQVTPLPSPPEISASTAATPSGEVNETDSALTPTPTLSSSQVRRINESSENILKRSELVDSFSYSGNPTDLRGAQWTINIESRAVPESLHVATFNREKYYSQQRALSGLGSVLLSAALRGFYRTAVIVTLPPGVQLTDSSMVYNSSGRTLRSDGSVLLPGGTFASKLFYGNNIPLGTRGYLGPDEAKLVVFYSPDNEVNPNDEDMMDGTIIPDVSVSFGPNFNSRRQGGLNRYITYFFVQQAIRGPDTDGIGMLMRSYESNQGYIDAIGFHGILLHNRVDWKRGVEPTPRPPMPTATPRPPGFDPSWYIEKGRIFGCLIYKNQSQAQAVLRADPSDPNRLDTDRNGIACDAPNIGSAPFDRTPVARPVG